jgi:lipid-A-disaccharide synthase
MTLPADAADERAAVRDNTGTPLNVFLIAGEASGDALGGALMAALRDMADRPVRFSGVGGPVMAAQGQESLFDFSELSIMGLIEILPHARQLLRRIRQTATAIEADPPDVLVTIDSPGFVFRVIQRLAMHDAPRVHYVAPTVWAWRPNRVHKFRRHFDRLLALLPFEPDYFERVGLPCTFVGHPVVEVVREREACRKQFRADHDVAPAATLLCVLPGSRRGELDRHLVPFGDTVRLLAARHPDLHIVVPTLPYLQARIAAATATWPATVTIVTDAAVRVDAMIASDAALAASGTVTLELAQARVPTVVAYRVAPLTAWLVRRMIRVDYVSIVNLIAGKAVIPEYLQGDVRPAALAQALTALLSDPERRVAMQQAQAAAMVALGEGGEPPSRRAAAAVLDVVRDWRKTAALPVNAD